jgi:hypothetical protein
MNVIQNTLTYILNQVSATGDPPSLSLSLSLSYIYIIWQIKRVVQLVVLSEHTFIG